MFFPSLLFSHPGKKHNFLWYSSIFIHPKLEKTKLSYSSSYSSSFVSSLS